MHSNDTTKETKTIVFRIDHKEYMRIDEVAKRFHINRSSIIRMSIAKFLEDITEGYLRLPGNNPEPAKNKESYYSDN